MNDWLGDPLVQSGVLPFAAGLIVAAALHRSRLSGLAAGTGFVVAVWLIGDFVPAPSTAARKLVVIGVAAVAAGVLLDMAGVRRGRHAAAMLALVFGAATVWMLWTALSQQPAATAVATGAGAFACIAWLVALALAPATAGDPLRGGANALVLGVGSGVAAMLGGSALLAQYGIALGAACGAWLLVATLRPKTARAGNVLALTAAVVSGLVMIGAAVLAHLPWLALAALALVPATVHLPLPAPANAWLRAAFAAGLAGMPAMLACAIAWWAAAGDGA